MYSIISIFNDLDLKESIKRSNEEISKNELNKKLMIMQRQQEQRINRVQNVRYHSQCNNGKCRFLLFYCISREFITPIIKFIITMPFNFNKFNFMSFSKSIQFFPQFFIFN